MASVVKEIELNEPPKDGVSNLVFSPTGHLLLATSWDCSIRVYDTVSNGLSHLSYSKAPVLDACFGETNAVVFSGGLDREVTQLDIATGTKRVVGGHSESVKSLLFSQSHHLLVSGSWDRTVKTWDLRAPADAGAAATIECPGKVYAAALCGADTLVVGTSERHVQLFDLRRLASHGARASDAVLQRRESSLKHQTRVIRAFPDGAGFATGSTEGRIAIDFVDPNPAVQAGKYAFKCHRAKQPSGDERVFPVHAIAFHPTFGTFASGGGDGLVNIWDWVAKKRLAQLPAYQTSVSALAFSADGSQLAVAASYAYETGEQPAHPPDAIFVRPVSDSDVRPKAK